MNSNRKRTIKKILIVYLCIALFAGLIAIGIYAVNKLDNRTVNVVYDNTEVSLMAIQDEDGTVFRYLSNQQEYDKGDEFYLSIELKDNHKLKAIKIDGLDKTDELLTYTKTSELEEVPEKIKDLIKSNKDKYFIITIRL